MATLAQLKARYRREVGELSGLAPPWMRKQRHCSTDVMEARNGQDSHSEPDGRVRE